jgi:hypothetical protein
MREYDPRGWFWIVAGDETRWWSSASAGYIPPSQPFLDGGGIPTSILNEQELTDVLAPYSLKGPYISTDPNDYPLRPDQFFAMLDIAGLTASVTAAVDAISDPKTKAIAKAKLNHTSSFHRDLPHQARVSAHTPTAFRRFSLPERKQITECSLLVP